MGDHSLGGPAEHVFRVQEWFVAFKHTSDEPLARWLTWRQRFKHVMAFGFIPATGCWLFYDWDAGRTGIWVVPDDVADTMIARAQNDAVVLRFVPPRYVTERRFKPGQWCVTSVAHLIGVRSCALRPDGLFADCIREGGTIVAEPHESARDQAGPGAATAGSCCPAG